MLTIGVNRGCWDVDELRPPHEGGTKILGIDPGLRFTGWGIVDARKDGSCLHVSHGVIRVPLAPTLPLRLNSLFESIRQIIIMSGAIEVAVEEVFVNNNGDSTIKLCMARGVAMLAPTLLGKEVFEYPANFIKKSIIGNGHASKESIKNFLPNLLLNLPTDIAADKTDSTDALAVALCHANCRKLNGILKNSA
jgi:crossover junction endodeoxyribonuclease RuvC